MDSDPKTRRESKKSAKDKKESCYSSKHVRQLEALRLSSSNKSKENKTKK
jgi:hypothetical protein